MIVGKAPLESGDVIFVAAQRSAQGGAVAKEEHDHQVIGAVARKQRVGEIQPVLGFRAGAGGVVGVVSAATTVPVQPRLDEIGEAVRSFRDALAVSDGIPEKQDTRGVRCQRTGIRVLLAELVAVAPVGELPGLVAYLEYRSAGTGGPQDRFRDDQCSQKAKRKGKGPEQYGAGAGHYGAGRVIPCAGP